MAILGTDLLEAPTIYKAYLKGYVGGYPLKIWPEKWYSTSILGSWNSHWFTMRIPRMSLLGSTASSCTDGAMSKNNQGCHGWRTPTAGWGAPKYETLKQWHAYKHIEWYIYNHIYIYIYKYSKLSYKYNEIFSNFSYIKVIYIHVCYETQFEMVDFSNYETLKDDLSKNMSQTPIPWA